MRLESGAALLSVFFLSGCVVRDRDPGCDGFWDCGPGGTCDRATGLCYLPGSDYEPLCQEPSDCSFGETCTPEHLCRSGSCAFHGCVEGYSCLVVEGVFECVAGSVDAGALEDASASLDGSVSADASDASGDAAAEAPVDAVGSPPDAGSGQP